MQTVFLPPPIFNAFILLNFLHNFYLLTNDIIYLLELKSHKSFSLKHLEHCLGQHRYSVNTSLSELNEQNLRLQLTILHQYDHSSLSEARAGTWSSLHWFLSSYTLWNLCKYHSLKTILQVMICVRLLK